MTRLQTSDSRPRTSPMYFGKSGEVVAMSELLLRGYNVAIPAVDIGDDIYVVEDAESNLIRVQVKSTACRKRKDGYFARLMVSARQIRESKRTKLVFIFALRHERHWHFIIISRDKLEEEMSQHKIGRKNRSDIAFSFRWRSGALTCSGRDFSEYLDWDAHFPAG